MSNANEDATAVSTPDVTQLTDDDIGAYLGENPDFLARNPDILRNMMAPSRWSDDGVADIQQFMLEQLRGEIDNLRDCAQDVIETSRTNMSVQTRTHTAVLALLSTTSLDHLFRVINDDLPLLLDIDTVTIGFEASPVSPQMNAPILASPHIRRFVAGDVDRFIGDGLNINLVRDADDDGVIFGEAAGLVSSAALARIRPGLTTPMGLFALGCRGSTFYPGQGTELIGFLARVLERCIDRWQETVE